jgi:hypothetical protein
MPLTMAPQLLRRLKLYDERRLSLDGVIASTVVPVFCGVSAQKHLHGLSPKDEPVLTTPS